MKKINSQKFDEEQFVAEQYAEYLKEQYLTYLEYKFSIRYLPLFKEREAAIEKAKADARAFYDTECSIETELGRMLGMTEHNLIYTLYCNGAYSMIRTWVAKKKTTGCPLPQTNEKHAGYLEEKNILYVQQNYSMVYGVDSDPDSMTCLPYFTERMREEFGLSFSNAELNIISALHDNGDFDLIEEWVDRERTKRY